MVCPVCETTYGWDTRFCPLDGSTLHPVTTSGDDLIGTILDGRYVVIEKLGQGGMGEVYLGEHVLTKRRCAVKIVREVLAGDRDAFGRFIREATNAGRISHPHVATVYDFGRTENGMLYLAMEYVDGEPLSALLEREGVLSPARTVEIAGQVAAAVSAAHDLGIVHRDLKPGNILVARDRKGADVVKVVDFGIARATTDEQQNLTRSGVVVGTPEYMSPEQLIGDPIDARSDIYALGCILYQMLTGEHAFNGPTVRLITRRLTEKPPHPRDTNHAIPKALDELVVTALARTPQERFQTMEALHDALLAVPVRPVRTGPRRLAAWLGLGSASGQHSPADTGRATGETPTAAATQPLLVAGPPARTREATVETTARERGSGEIPATEITTLGSSGEEAVGEPGLTADESALGPPPRSLVPRFTVALGTAAVLFVAAVALWPSEPEPAPEPGNDVAAIEANPLATEPEPEPLPPPDSVLAGIREELITAEQEDGDLQFAAAIVRLRSAETRLSALLATHPDLADIRQLADSAHAQLERVEKRCDTLRRHQLSRNERPPDCAEDR